MKIKKLLFLLTGVMSLSIAACSSNAGSSNAPQDTSKQDDSTSEVISSSNPSEVSSQDSSSNAPSSRENNSSSSAPASSPKQDSSSAQQSSSKQDSSSAAPVETPIEVSVDVGSYSDETKTYHFPFTFKESMFNQASTSFSKDIAMFAYGNAVANQTKDSINKFYADAGFDHVELSATYDVAPTSTSIAYAFAHKVVNQKDFISVSIRGFNYGQEWADNFNIGLEGEHAGFAARADLINGALKTYMSTNGYQKNNSTLFINGYSRGGAVANLLAKRVNDEEALASKNNIFTYTFEAPRGAVEKGEYNNIFNVLSQGDVVTHLAPSAYGFTRYGIDIDIYDSDIDNLVAAFDENLVFPPFNSELDEGLTCDLDLPDYFLNNIVEFEGEEDQPMARTREEFVTNFQETISYGLGMFFALKPETVAAIKEGVAALEGFAILGLLAEDGLYNFLDPYIAADGFEYVSEDLRTHCNNAVNFIIGPGVVLIILLTDDSGIMNRALLQHTPEINYVLLNNYTVAE